jgi:hypothetical protein
MGIIARFDNSEAVRLASYSRILFSHWGFLSPRLLPLSILGHSPGGSGISETITLPEGD